MVQLKRKMLTSYVAVLFSITHAEFNNFYGFFTSFTEYITKKQLRCALTDHSVEWHSIERIPLRNNPNTYGDQMIRISPYPGIGIMIRTGSLPQATRVFLVPVTIKPENLVQIRLYTFLILRNLEFCIPQWSTEIRG